MGKGWEMAEGPSTLGVGAGYGVLEFTRFRQMCATHISYALSSALPGPQAPRPQNMGKWLGYFPRIPQFPRCSATLLSERSRGQISIRNTPNVPDVSRFLFQTTPASSLHLPSFLVHNTTDSVQSQPCYVAPTCCLIFDVLQSMIKRVNVAQVFLCL